MPLAPAHPAVVLPLQRIGLPLSALVAGAVAPDTAVYLPAAAGRDRGPDAVAAAGQVAAGAACLAPGAPCGGDRCGGLPVYAWLQHPSTVAGFLVVVAYSWARLHEEPVVPRQPQVRRTTWWLAVVPVTGLAAGALLGDVNVAVGAALVAVVAVALAWRSA